MFTIGIDFGSNSVRALVVRCSDGAEFGVGVAEYHSGAAGILLDPRDHLVARQHPGDYLAGLEASVRGALDAAACRPGFDRGHVVGIGVDATGSSPLPVDAANRALGADPRWKDALAAQCWLWKDHTSWAEAERFTAIATEHRPHYLARCGGVYSSEWWWAKIWHCLNVAPDVFDAAASWVELADWIPSVLAGIDDPRNIRRGICAAGHKALYATEWGGLPDRAFLDRLDPRLGEIRDRLYATAHDANARAGLLCPAWADRLGLLAGVPIAVGAFDVHYGAIGCGIEQGTLVKVIGTSTCDCAVVAADRPIPTIPGVCGVVLGSILPGAYGIEAGQSAVGDIFKWWVEGICAGAPPLHATLTAEAAALAPGQSGLLALDWNNGNRTVLVDQLLSGLIMGQTLYSTRAEIYRALIEATAFGARVIVERLRDWGIRVDRVTCTGGIAERNPLLMQIYADVIGCDMRIADSSQTCALGSAIVAAVLAGAHHDFAAAQVAMTSLRDDRYRPIERHRAVYDAIYRLYLKLHDSFGGVGPSSNLARCMKDLLALKHGEAASVESSGIP